MVSQTLDSQEFRKRIQEARESYPHHWEASGKLMASESLSATLPALLQYIQTASSKPSETLDCSPSAVWAAKENEAGASNITRTDRFATLQGGSCLDCVGDPGGK